MSDAVNNRVNSTFFSHGVDLETNNIGLAASHLQYKYTSSKNPPKLCVTGLCGGNSPVMGEFPAQRALNAEMFPFDDVIMSDLRYKVRHDLFTKYLVIKDNEDVLHLSDII